VSGTFAACWCCYPLPTLTTCWSLFINNIQSRICQKRGWGEGGGDGKRF
jgi:hypothetical protein